MPAVDPNAPVQEVGETAANFTLRVQDYQYKQGGGIGSPNYQAAQQFIALIVSNPAPTAWTIK